MRVADSDGKFETKESFGGGSVTGIGIRNGYISVAEVNSVERFKMTPGQLKPADAAEEVGSGLPGGRQHCDKGIAFDGKGWLYVNVGAPSDACQARDRQKDVPGQDPCPILENNDGIWKFDEIKLGQNQEDGSRFATGLRQMPAIAMNNRDSLDRLWPGKFTGEENATRAAEPLYRALEGPNFGWPFCFFDYRMQKLLLNPEYGGNSKTEGRCTGFTLPAASFPAHSAPVGPEFL